jgi:hypothetical protein
MKDTRELSPVQVLREATTADLASEIGTARSVSGWANETSRMTRVRYRATTTTRNHRIPCAVGTDMQTEPVV